MAERKFGRKAQRKSYDSHGECTNKNNISNRVDELISMANFDTDPNGSYTGVPETPGEVPVQDADDL